MASDNQPISDKRRRLFKALSAAPVVATLRPGEALANSSAFQCAASLRKIQIQPFINQNNTPTSCAVAVGEDCTIEGIIYRKVHYWNKGNENFGNSLTGYCKDAWDSLPQRIVQIPIFPGGTLKLVDLQFSGTQGTATPVPNGVFSPIPEISVDSNNAQLIVSDPTDSAECFRRNALTGLAAYVGQTVDDEAWTAKASFHSTAFKTAISEPTLEPIKAWHTAA